MISFSPSFRQLLSLAALVAASLFAASRAAAQGVSDSDRSKRAATKLREDALAAIGAGDNDRAFKLARTAMRAAPEDPQVVFLVALILGQRNRFYEAIKMLDDLADRVPATQFPVLVQTAEWMVQSGQWADAEQRYRTVLSGVPDSILVHRNLASLLIRQGRRIEAAGHLRQLCRLTEMTEAELRSLLMIVHPFAGDVAKEEFDPIGTLGQARHEIGLGDWEAARRRLESSKSPIPAETALLGRVYAQLREVEETAAWVARTPESATLTEHADYWFAMGSYHVHQKEHVKAVRCFCEAVLRDPTDKQAYELLGKSLKLLNAAVEAKEALKRAELLEKTQVLGAEMAANGRRDDEKMATLIELLDQLHRPLEALSWRGVRLAYGRANSYLSDAQAQQIFAEIMRDRSEWLNKSEDPATRQFLLCGVDLDSLEPRDRDRPLSESQP